MAVVGQVPISISEADLEAVELHHTGRFARTTVRDGVSD